jgi:hypothetical protein
MPLVFSNIPLDSITVLELLLTFSIFKYMSSTDSIPMIGRSLDSNCGAWRAGDHYIGEALTAEAR